MEIMRDVDSDEVMVVDAQTKAPLGVVSRATLVQHCVRAWHEPARCRIGSHVRSTGAAGTRSRQEGEDDAALRG